MTVTGTALVPGSHRSATSGPGPIACPVVPGVSETDSDGMASNTNRSIFQADSDSESESSDSESELVRF
jgi:hypothetical protein